MFKEQHSLEMDCKRKGNILINQSMLWCLNEYVVCFVLVFQIVKAAW
jgi:hypothetical protein